MKRVLGILSFLVVAVSAANLYAADKPKAEERTFELKPVAPPTPALKYQLLFDDATDRRPGNAALLYLQSILIMGPEIKEKAQKALDAYEGGEMTAFRQFAEEAKHPSLFDELDLAGRRETCDWQPPIREKGVETLLPHLEPLKNGVLKAVKVRALTQIEQGNVEDALVTLRLGYELANRVGEEPVLISALVSLAMTRAMNDGLVHAMNRPESPNLYWALAEFPDRRNVFRCAYDGERRFLLASVPNLAKWKAGTDLSADEWRETLGYIQRFVTTLDGKPSTIGPIKAATAQNLEQARRDYAAAHHLSADEAAKVDPTVALGELYYRTYENTGDEFYMLRGMPWSLLLEKSRQFDERYEKLKWEQPGNPFLLSLPQLAKVTWPFARTDRELAALTAVEALRSYAAEHGGKLPENLNSVTATPVPNNPATGKPFEYHLEYGTAILADTQSEEPLSYTVKIRQP